MIYDYPKCVGFNVYVYFDGLRGGRSKPEQLIVFLFGFFQHIQQHLFLLYIERFFNLLQRRFQLLFEFVSLLPLSG